MREKLAEYAHDVSWTGWMIHMFSVCIENEDGSLTIPADKVKRWSGQMATSYKDLPEDMKPSDREQADNILEIVKDSTFKKGG